VETGARVFSALMNIYVTILRRHRTLPIKDIQSIMCVTYSGSRV